MQVGRPARSPSSRASSTILDTATSANLAAKGSGSSDHNAGRLKDFVDSYMRQLYGGNTTTRLLAAQALGAFPSFLPPSRGADALRLSVELGVVGSLTDVLTADDEMPVQEACLMALAALLLSTASYEDHSAPLRPQHLKLLGPTILRPEVMAQIGYLLTATANTRVVLAAARVMAISAPYITQSNDLYVLDSRIVPALLAAAAARPDPAGRQTGGGDGAAAASPAAASNPTPRDAAACVLALLTLAQTTPDLYVAVCTADVLQAVSVLYERCIDPDQTSDVVLPADAAALLLRAATLEPNAWWAARLPAGHQRTLERNLEESDVPECLVSFLAVEAANLRRLGEDLAAAAAGNAEAVVEDNGLEMEHLQAELRERRQQLAEAQVAAQDAWRKLQAAEAEADRVQGVAEEAAAPPPSQQQRRASGSTQQQRKTRREAEVEAAAAAAVVEGRRRGAEAAAAVLEELQEQVAALRREAAPLRWQSERMAQLGSKMQAWRGKYGFKSRSRVKLSRPNLAMLTQVLAFLAARVKPAPAPERGASSRGGPAAGASNREHVAALQAKLLEAGLVQAVLQLFTVLSAVQSLAGELAALAGDLALQPDMAAALEVAAGQLQRESTGLAAINQRVERRLQQVTTEAARLHKALKLELPRREGSPRGVGVELGPGNSLSRVVRQEDVRHRLESLESEAGQLRAALRDSEPLVDFLQDRIQAVTSASSALSDSYAIFLKAFPGQAAPATPARAPSTASTNGKGDGDEEQHSRALRLASRSIMAKDPAHPSGHLLGLLSRAMAPVTRGSLLNVPALVRQLVGRPPGGAAATTWPPSPANPPEAAAAAAAGSLGSGPGPGSIGRSRSMGSAVLAAGRPRSASAIGPQGSLALTSPYAPAAARPGSARSGPNVERSNASGGLGSPRASALYGGGSGAFGGFLDGGPFPTDAKGRPMRYPKDSMYGTIQATFSPMRSYSAVHNGPRFALLLREKGAAAAAVRTSSSSAAAAAVRGSRSAAGGGGGSLALDTPFAARDSELTASVSLPLADESRRVVHHVVSSLLFDPVDADVLGPGVLRASLASAAASASLTLADGLSVRPITAHSSRPLTSPPPPEAAAGEAAAGGGESGGGGGGDVSVLDALLMQSELLCLVMEALARLEQFSKTTSRTCRQLPATVSYASLQPGGLGPYMARLHGMWAGAITKFPDMRLQVTESVVEIAQLALVPGADFQAVYRETGMMEVLLQMLAGALRPGKAGGKAGAGGGAAASTGAGAGGGSGLKPRYVGRLTATAPPTLRVGAAQQAEQAAAGQALRAISHAQSEVLVSIGQDEQLLTRLSKLVLDHSMSWSARQAAADLLSDLVLGGGPGAEAAVASGAYAGLVEMINRDMYPFLNQDPRGSKETVVSALACLAAHQELLEGVVAAAQASHGPSSGLPLGSTVTVMSAILRSLWGVIWQVYTTYISDRTGHGRHVDPDLISGLTSTAATAARELAVLADTVPEARRALISELGLRGKISTTFLQAVKDPVLYEAIVEVRKNLS